MNSQPVHPTIAAVEARNASTPPPPQISSTILKEWIMKSGADDAGVVSLSDPAIDDQRAQILEAAPWATSLVSFVCRTNVEPIRSPARSVANLEFHRTGDEINDVAAAFVAKLQNAGVKAINPAMGFPMEMENFSTRRQWVVSHKPIAEAAGLGVMGIHRNVIHPKFGNFVLLGTVITNLEVNQAAAKLDFNPCLECKLCVAACPVGAVKPDGAFDFGACYTHNYREFMTGFGDFVDDIADSSSRSEFRKKKSQTEVVSMWQSLSFGANYKAAYCMSVCPAGEDVIGPYMESKGEFRDQVLKPLQDKEETLFVVRGSDAERHAIKRFPHKTVRQVHSGMRLESLDGLRNGMPLIFNRERAKKMEATFQFILEEDGKIEPFGVSILKGVLNVTDGRLDHADVTIRGRADAWIGFLNREKNLVWQLLTRRIKISGKVPLMKDFAACFPG